MNRVSRDGVSHFKEWPSKVHAALPDLKRFRATAKAFERLALNGTRRRAGFASYAPHVLVARGKKREFPAVWTHAKEHIAKLTGHLCAYCQSQVEDGQVEHVRPKSLFPTLAYDWSNYLLSCGPCNRAKSNKWPAKGEYVRPDRGRDPELRFVYADDGSMAGASRDLLAEQTVTDINLNRPGLRRRRRAQIALNLRTLRLVLGRSGISLKDQRALARCIISAPELVCAAAVRASARRAWRLAHPNAKCP